MKNKDVTAYIEAAAEYQVELLNELRKIICAVSPEVSEQYKWSRPVYSISKDFCYLKTAKKYVTLGFFQFDKVRTNKSLLEGTGKQMRHIKLRSIEDIKKFDIPSMLKEVVE